MSLRDLLKKGKPKVVPLDMTEEWGQPVYVKSLTVGQSNQLKDLDGDEAVYAQVCFGLCDADGNELYWYPADKSALEEFYMVDLVKVMQAITNASTVAARIDQKKVS